MDKPLPGRFTFKVVGVTFAEGYPANLYRLEELSADALLSGREVRIPAVLRRQPQNEHDPNAVAVIVVAAGGHIGHVPRVLAARLAPLMDEGADYEAWVSAVLVHPDAPQNPGITVHAERAP